MRSKFWSGVLAFLPLCGMGVYMFLFIRMMIDVFASVGDEGANNGFFIHNMPWLIGSGFLLFLLTIGALIYFIVHLVNNRWIDSTERIIWILLFVFAGMIAFPIYWFMRIRTAKPSSESPAAYS